MLFGTTQNPDEVDQPELIQSGFRYACSLTHNHADAEDLVQEAWLALSRKYGQVSGKALLFCAIRNLFRDRCRRSQLIQFEPLSPIENEGADYSTSPSAEGDIEILLSTLTPGEREAVYLNCVEGYTAEEIGKLSNQPRGTVLSLLSRAKRKLRQVADVFPVPRIIKLAGSK
ncbi:MAG: polymerase ECF-type sigma factor [Verrucomicrobiales bacterium]|nr:polymerase ECF-type sigma factor [Verrucomicrobiales bacterium]